MSEYSFELKYNNAGVNATCFICGNRTDPQVGLWIFKEGTYTEPCEQCAAKYAPDLWAVVEYWHKCEAERLTLSNISNIPEEVTQKAYKLLTTAREYAKLRKYLEAAYKTRRDEAYNYTLGAEHEHDEAIYALDEATAANNGTEKAKARCFDTLSALNKGISWHTQAEREYETFSRNYPKLPKEAYEEFPFDDDEFPF